MSEGGRSFASVAERLAGLAGWHLRWSAEQFWAATPAEMEVIIRVMIGGEGEGADAVPPSRTDIARLQELFPDG